MNGSTHANFTCVKWYYSESYIIGADTEAQRTLFISEQTKMQIQASLMP